MSQTLSGIYDFGYAPYALGDAITFVMNLQCLAVEYGATQIEILLMVEPGSPSNAGQATKVTPQNFHQATTSLLPAFTVGANISGVRLFTNRGAFNHALHQRRKNGGKFWPSLGSHYRQTLDYASHRLINRHFRQHGSLPPLKAPSGYGARVEALFDRLGEDTTVVALHVRQRALTGENAALHRDSDAEAWAGFLERVAVEHPHTVFFLLGGFDEWQRDVLAHRNVLISRTLGLGLGDELALMFKARMFMGTNSGFAAIGYFTELPYVITNAEPATMEIAEIPANAPRFNIAQVAQYITWTRESSKSLWELYERILAESDARNGAVL